MLKKTATEDEMFGWDHWLNGHEFEQTPGDSEGQGSLAWYSSRGCKKSDMSNILKYLGPVNILKNVTLTQEHLRYVLLTLCL